MSDVFISYKSEDEKRARELGVALKAEGWSAWWDKTIPPGKTWDQVIGAELKAARCVIVLWSSRSVASNWVKEEADVGLRREILVPALIEAVEIPLGFRSVQAAHLEHWHGDRADPEFRKLCDAVRANVAAAPAGDRRPAPSPQPPPPLPDASGLWWKVALAAALVAVLAAGGWYWSRSQRRRVVVSATTTTTTIPTATTSTTTITPTATTPTRTTTTPSESPRVVPARVTVPVLVGMTLREASTQLRGLGLEMGEITRRPTTNQAERSRIIEQSPAANESVPPGSAVKVTALVYEEPGPGATPQADCRTFNPQTAAVRQAGASWRIVDGNQLLFDFGTEQSDAHQALRVIASYRMSVSCAVGRPPAGMRYLMAGARPPSGALPGEDCIGFDPRTIRVEYRRDRWAILGESSLFSFGEEGDARQALAVIQRFGFTQSCYVGSPRRSRAFSYLRR